MSAPAAPATTAGVWRGILVEYADRMPIGPDTPIVTLREGGTPLIHSEELSERTGCEVHLKYDGANPTGSFKDRGMTVAISKAKEAGARAVICASTGNTSAAAAAYAAKAGMSAAVVVPRGKIALGKLAQAVIHGATILQIDGNFDQALTICRELADRHPVELVNSVNPYRIDGQRTAAWEICDQLGRAPDLHLMPVGNAGNITAQWRGYREYLDEGRIDAAPVIHGFQAAGAAPIVHGAPVDRPETIASAIRIGNPASWDRAGAARDESGGTIRAVSDRELLTAFRTVARAGVFAELASAASVAGLLRLHAEGALPRGATVVCMLTGHGLKDPEWAVAGAPAAVVVPPDAARAAEALGLA
ncbi:MAG: threonine synthase [Nitriliruptoraceae bacterium]